MVKQKCNLNDRHFIKRLGIINSIPSDWKSQIKLHFSNDNSQDIGATQHCMLPDMSVKAAYNSLMKSLLKPQNTSEYILR